MFTYFLCFIGRENGAIGIVHNCTIELHSEIELSETELLNRAYSTHEHISNFSIQDYFAIMKEVV